MKDFVIQLQGGIGKHIAATSFIKWINDKYPEQKITVVSSFPEVFEYNPHIYRNLPQQQAYLFQDYIKGRDYRNGEPYHCHEFYDERMSIMKLYPKAYQFGEYNENPKSEIFLTEGERQEMELFAKSGPPVITMQVFGGVPPGQAIPVRKADIGQRDMPMELAMKLSGILQANGFRVLQVRQMNEPQIPGTLQMNMPFRNWMALSSYIVGHVGIDSSFMHSAAVFEKPMLIFWSQTHKDSIGYNYDKVINAFKKGSMKYRPQIAMPDRAAMFPYRDKSESTSWNYTSEQISNYMEDFLNKVDNKKFKKGDKNVKKNTKNNSK